MAKKNKQETPLDPNRQVSEAEERQLMQRLSASRTKLLAMVPFFGHLCLNLRPRMAQPQDRVPTAAVSPDGTLTLNYDFCMKLTDAQLCGLLCHEVLHPALFCFTRMGSRRAIVSGPGGQKFSLWNLAHDLSFNPDIVELAERTDGKGTIELPPGGVLDKAMRGMAAEEIYDKLLKQALDNRDKGNGGEGGFGVLTDIPGGGDHGIGDDMRPDLAQTKDGKQAAQGDKGASKKLENDWKVSVVAAAQIHQKEKKQGKLPGNLQKIIDELVDPRLDWKDVLSRWIGENGKRQDYTYRRPARRSESVGEYMPSIMRFGVADICVLWDTSGSMNGREKEILGDVQGICEDLGLSIRCITCDTQVHTDVDNIEDALDLIPHIRGGGGSDFTPAFKRLEDENYDGVVVAFTDGYIGVPQIKPIHIKEVLWVLAGGDVDPTGGKWGDVLKINDEVTIG